MNKLLSLAAVGMLLVFIGCAGGGMNSPARLTANPTTTAAPAAPAPPSTTPGSTTPAPAPSSSRVAVTLGDAAGDRILSFEVTITNVALTGAGGSSVTLFTGSRQVEVTHLAGTFLPVALASAPQGTYSKADVTITDPEVVFIGSDGKAHKFEDPTLTRTITINISPALTIGANAVVLNLDLDVAASVLIDTTTNSITVNPTIVATSAKAEDNANDAEHGELDDVRGLIQSVDAQTSQLTILVGQTGDSLTINVNSSTRFRVGDGDAASLATLATGMLVRVKGSMQTDGTLLATEVEASASVSGSEAEGVVTSVTGAPATQLTVLVQDGSGAGLSSNSSNPVSLLGTPVTVAISDTTKFSVQADGIAIDPSVFPFDASHIKAGQRVESESDVEFESGDAAAAAPAHSDDNGGSGSSGDGNSGDGDATSTLPKSGAIAASRIRLQPQALVGTVSSFTVGATGSTFVLTVDADSTFALLSGSTQVTVTTVSATQTDGNTVLPPATAGAKLRVRGLVFFDGTTFQMLALRISTP